MRTYFPVGVFVALLISVPLVSSAQSSYQSFQRGVAYQQDTYCLTSTTPVAITPVPAGTPFPANCVNSIAPSVTTNSSSASTLAAQAEALLQQIAALQAQLAAQTSGTTTVVPPTTTVSSANCPLIGRVLKLGSTGDDVSRLQRFLAVDPSIYPEAQITGYYGVLTEAAVKRWQTRFNIVSSGDAASTGFGVTGPRTAAAISLQCSTYSGSGGGTVVPGGSPNVGGFIQVTPINGNAPLTVQVTATVNTVNSCDAATYTLNWGDGTVPQTIQVPAGRCGQLQQNYSHIYLYGGAYMIRLSAGEHSTTATVNVYGAAGQIIQQTQVTNPGIATISVTSPGSGLSYDAGARADIAWVGTGSIPSGSRVYIDVITSTGTKVGSTLDNTSNISGSYQWQIPSSFTPGSYKIRTTVMNGSQTVAIGESPTFTVNAPVPEFSYVPIGVTPLVQNNPLQVAVSFNIPTSCTGYSLSWGDGTSDTVQAHSTGCTNAAVTRIFTHTYAASGSYIITLRRGSDLSRVDTASVVITN